MYNISVMERFVCPKNSGSLRQATVIGMAENADKGDVVKFYFKINATTHVIEDAHFKTLGCPAAIACSDIVCDMIKGKTVEQASKISNVDIIGFLGELPVDKISCATTVEAAMQATIKKFHKQQTKKEKNNKK